MVEELLYLSRSNGVLSLYSGLAPTLWRDVPFSAIYWLCLERIRDALSSSHENTRFLGKWGGYYYKIELQLEDIPPIVDAAHSFVSGAIAGSIAAAFTTPFDVVKTRRQIMIGQSIDNVLYSNNDNRRRMCTVETSRSRLQQQQQQQQQRVNIGELGTFGHMRHIAQEEGIVGLWKGNVTRILKVAPACAIMISCYEFGKRIFTL
jgi:solute carrier family 25 protein 39/40